MDDCFPLVSRMQIKAARALIGWSQSDLGDVLGVNERQIRFWERRLPQRKSKLLALVRAFDAAGVIFTGLPTIGVLLKSDA